MKLISLYAENFGSYDNVVIRYDNAHLTMVYGSTGSGKSTLQDMACWGIFGITSKNGSVSEVINWKNQKPAKVTVQFEHNQKNYSIVRIRGNSSKDNDLYYSINSLEYVRGKDIGDTQQRLEKELGISSNLYILSSCFNETSPSLNFFVNKAKNRRELFETIADLKFPIELKDRITASQKTYEFMYDATSVTNLGLEHEKSYANKSLQGLKKLMDEWQKKHILDLETYKNQISNHETKFAKEVEQLKLKSKLFNDNKKTRIKELTSRFNENIENTKSNIKCEHCGEPSSNGKKILQSLEEDLLTCVDRISLEEDPYVSRLERLDSNNIYLHKYESEKSKLNPFQSQYDSLTKNIEEQLIRDKMIKDDLSRLNHVISSLEQLSEFSTKLKLILLNNTISLIEQETNEKLEKFFDSELKINFELTNKEDLNVIIYKNGYECSYTQLSKGQKGLLKLCFATSVMDAASNSSGTHFNTLFFDEALDGLDTDLKVKAFGIFQELAKTHDSVFVIDHSPDLRNLFDNRINIQLIEDQSVVTYES